MILTNTKAELGQRIGLRGNFIKVTTESKSRLLIYFGAGQLDLFFDNTPADVIANAMDLGFAEFVLVDKKNAWVTTPKNWFGAAEPKRRRLTGDKL